MMINEDEFLVLGEIPDAEMVKHLLRTVTQDLLLLIDKSKMHFYISPDEQRFVIFGFLLDCSLCYCTDMMHSEKCMLGVLTSKLALGSSERADVGLCLCV